MSFAGASLRFACVGFACAGLVCSGSVRFGLVCLGLAGAGLIGARLGACLKISEVRAGFLGMGVFYCAVIILKVKISGFGECHFCSKLARLAEMIAHVADKS